MPVVIGGGQFTNRETDPSEAPDPFELMRIAARGAAGPRPELLRELTHLWMVHSLSLRHADPAGFLAQSLGADKCETRCSGMGGSVPQWLVDRACELVLSGSRPLVLVVGAEALATRKRAKREGVELNWPSERGWPGTWPPIEPDLGVHPVERAQGLDQATAMYALIETALAHRDGHDPGEHRHAMALLMERFNEVASKNPNSWFPERRSVSELESVTADNRIIYHPYPKYMNAVMDVDMSGAVLVTDAQSAQDLGMSEDELVYVTGWADAHDIWYLSERADVGRSQSAEICASTALEMAGLEVEDVSAFDLYSCFPSSIEVARDCIGVEAGDPRPLTITGGLPYHGGPGSNYVTHSIANARDWILAGRGDSVLVQGNGYYLTKESVGIYSKTPSGKTASARKTQEELQSQVDSAAQKLEVVAPPHGEGTVVAYTVPYDRSGEPLEGVVLVDVDGRRTVTKAARSLSELLVSSDAVGTRVSIGDGLSTRA